MGDEALQLAQSCADEMLANDQASRALGIAIEVLAAGEVKAHMTVRADMVNGHDICHGGFIFTLADSAFAFACNAYNEVAVAATASIEFLAPGRLGDGLTAHARERQRGRRGGLYDVDVHNQEGRLVAVFRGRSATLGQALFPVSDT